MQRRYRLRNDRNFIRLRLQGRAIQHHCMRLSLISNGLPYNRYGFITSKRLGNAVIRNRVRRLLREAIRQLHPRLQAGFDIVLVARQPIVGQPFDVVQRIVKELLHQVDILVEGGPK